MRGHAHAYGLGLVLNRWLSTVFYYLPLEFMANLNARQLDRLLKIISLSKIHIPIAFEIS